MINKNEEKSRFKWNKAYTLVSLLVIIVIILAISLWIDPKGDSIIEKFPEKIQHDSTEMEDSISTEFNSR